nr:MAG TPA: hypothetical protein [Caudoviricetes sp.]
MQSSPVFSLIFCSCSSMASFLRFALACNIIIKSPLNFAYF